MSLRSYLVFAAIKIIEAILMKLSNWLIKKYFHNRKAILYRYCLNCLMPWLILARNIDSTLGYFHFPYIRRIRGDIFRYFTVNISKLKPIFLPYWRIMANISVVVEVHCQYFQCPTFSSIVEFHCNYFKHFCSKGRYFRYIKPIFHQYWHFILSNSKLQFWAKVSTNVTNRKAILVIKVLQDIVFTILVVSEPSSYETL